MERPTIFAEDNFRKKEGGARAKSGAEITAIPLSHSSCDPCLHWKKLTKPPGVLRYF